MKKIKNKVRRFTVDKAFGFKDKRISNNGTFIWSRRGNTYSYKSDLLQSDFLTSDMYNGIHIVSLVKKHLRKRLSSGLLNVPKISDNLVRRKIVFFDKKNVLKNNGCEVVAIDLNRCYWTTLYQLGYIDEKLYNIGLSKDSYKTVCNLSIGSLGMTEYFEVYKEGVLVDEYEKPSDFAGIRLHVISKVFKNAVNVINSSNECRDGFLWFLTDCFFVKKGAEAFFERAISDFGYKYKKKYHEKYVSNTEFRRNGDFRYFIKWDSWGVGLERNDVYRFNVRNNIVEILKQK